MEDRRLLSTWWVTNTNDSGAGSLRQAILDNNGDSANPSPDTIDFAIPGSGVQVIQPIVELPVVTHAALIDGYSQGRFSAPNVPIVNPSGDATPNTLAVGDNAVLLIELNGTNTVGYQLPFHGYDHGLQIAADDSNVQGFVVGGFGLAGISVTGANDAIQGCFIGTDPTGTMAMPNDYGVEISGAGSRLGTNGNGIDDTGYGINDFAERNLISGNTSIGVEAGCPAGVAVVAGNYIGTDRTGTEPLPNGMGVQASPGSLVGVDGNDADPVAERNLISGNINTGVAAYAGSVIAGNYIGVDATGTLPLGNTNVGVSAYGGALIGTDGNSLDDAAEGNVISGNGQVGIYASGQNNHIAGNYIGTDVTGVYGLGQPSGIFIDGNGSNNYIGLDPTDGSLHPQDERNVISGATVQNIRISGNGNTVDGNFIGTDASGTGAATSQSSGINISGSGNLIGTDSGGVNDGIERNIISGNPGNGVEISGGTGNVVAGNYIGTDPTGTTTANLGNKFAGVFFHNTTSGNQILRNVIDGSYYGVWMLGSGVSANVVAGNFIGTDWTGHVALGNLLGIVIGDSTSNQVGGTTPADRNLISGNVAGGVYLSGSSSGNQVLGNWIGTDATGQAPLGNGNGVGIADSASDNQIGGTAPGQGNTIAFNFGGGGVTFWETNTASGDPIRGNSIHDNGDLGIDLGGDGVTLNGSEPLGGPGPNNWQTFPVLTAAYAGASTVVTGTLSSIPCRTFTIDFYSNPAPDPSGYGQGQTYLGSTTVTTDASGNASFTATSLATSSLDQWISATATLTTFDANNNPTYLDTSEFSQDVQAVKAVTTTTLSASANPSVYGQSATFTATVTSTVLGDGTPTGSVQFVVDGSNFGEAVNLVNGVATSAAIGSLDAGSHMVTAIYSGDTDFIASTAASLTQVINKAHLTVTADPQTKTYDGSVFSPFTATLSGFVNGENSSVVSGSAGFTGSATTAVNAGSYIITPTAGTLIATNYDFTTFNTGTLTINQAHLTVTADNKTKCYGDANPTLSYSLSGFVNGETASVVSGSPTLITTATNSSPVAAYSITVVDAGTLSAANYDFPSSNFVNGTLTITKAPLIVTDSQTQVYGAAVALSPTYSGFVLGQNVNTAGITGAPTLSTTATATSVAGTYPITVGVGTLSSANYSFTPVNGTLTILGPGVYTVGSTLFVVGANTADYAQISPAGSKSDGTTGLQVNATLNNDYTSKSFSQPFTAIDVYGYGGNDNIQLTASLTLPTTIVEGNGNNYLLLAGGNDSVTLGSGGNQVFGGNGNKTITSSDAAGTSGYISLGNGNENIQLGQGNDQVVLGSGNNTVTSGNGNDAVTATGTGNNVITLGNGSDSINTGNGTDVISLGSGNENIQVGNGQKTIMAGGGNDYVHAGGGNVSVTLLGGSDNVQLGAGNDTVALGDGNDYVAAGDGNDYVTVGNGSDNVQLGNGSDVIVEGNGNDYVSAGNGTDLVVGGLGQHTIQLGNGNDILIDGSATVVNSGDSLRQILSDWNSSSSASVDTRLRVVYNTVHPNALKAGSGRDWWFFTYSKDVTNKKSTDRLN